MDRGYVRYRVLRIVVLAVGAFILIRLFYLVIREE
jgi:hypothetical protein